MRLYPVLLAVYPVVFSYAHNASHFNLHPLSVLLAAAGAALAVLASCLLARRLMDDPNRAALAVLVFWILFFTFGRVYFALSGQRAVPPDPVLLAALLMAWTGVLALVVRAVVRTRRDLEPVSRFLNGAAVCLVLLVSFNLGAHAFQEGRVRDLHAQAEPEAETLQVQLSGGEPDIYYIILDSYPSQETLKRHYGYDNEYFLEFLKDHGFYVASEARSNYPQTLLSLASSLNMRYLEELTEVPGRDSRDVTVPVSLLENNRVVEKLTGAGYGYVHFNSGWGPTVRNRHADINHLGHPLATEFAEEILYSTPLALTLGGEAARRRVESTFEHLPRLASQLEAPRFVFAHLIPPHPPYIFDGEGNPPARERLEMGDGRLWEDRKSYAGQVEYVNRRVKEVVESLLEPGPPDPVIIIQADHGTAQLGEREEGGWTDPDRDLFRERTSILSAYYVPEAVKEELYPSITPVNSFRLVFDHLFGTQLGLLPDRVMFSSYARPFDIKDVTEELAR